MNVKLPNFNVVNPMIVWSLWLSNAAAAAVSAVVMLIKPATQIISEL